MTDKETLEQQPEEELTEIPAETAEEETAGEAEAELMEEVMEEVAVAEEATQSAEIAALIEELTEARRSADEARDQALRTQAELQNFRRRKEREVGERIALANESLILELLPVLDDFERAFGAIPDDVREEHAAWIDGFDLIYRKLQKILENQGLIAIEAAGEFDPNVHEAVTMVPSEDAASGEVVQELRKGYKLKDKVVRASLVSVAQ
jgi:molecular chaperone GrpE